MERRMKKAGSRMRKQKWKTYEAEKAAHDQRKLAIFSFINAKSIQNFIFGCIVHFFDPMTHS